MNYDAKTNTGSIEFYITDYDGNSHAYKLSVSMPQLTKDPVNILASIVRAAASEIGLVVEQKMHERIIGNIHTPLNTPYLNNKEYYSTHPKPWDITPKEQQEIEDRNYATDLKELEKYERSNSNI